MKIEDPNEKIFMLSNDEFIVDLAAGALFSVALSNRGRVFIAGLIGGGAVGSLEEQLDKARFTELDLGCKISAISAGLSGASALTEEGTAFIWGRFGKTVLNVPRSL